MASFKNGRLYAVHEIHLESITQMLQFISMGEKVEAFKILQQVVRDGQYGHGCIVQSLAMGMLAGPQTFGNTFNSEEWSTMIDEICECADFYEITAWAGKYGDMATSRLGGF